MKKLTIYSFLLLPLVLLWACKKENYPGGDISDYISLFDIRNMYKGEDVILTKDNMFGSTKITGVVISDHSGNNLPKGLLVLQDGRRLSRIRGISVPIGDAAANYVPGDSVVIDVAGKKLTRIDGILQITGVDANGINKIAAGRPIPNNRVFLNNVIKNPNDYESSLCIIVKANFSPLTSPGDVLSGDRTVDDTYDQLKIHTETKATFANEEAPFYANYYGIFFNTTNNNGDLIPQFRLRTGKDVVKLNAALTPAPAIITGFMSDASGSDADYEYVQFMATTDIDFAKTPFSLVTTNNAGASTPIGIPVENWATGGLRTYQIKIFSGTVTKGSFFYVGGTKRMINGASSTVIPTNKWIKGYDYSKAGQNFGTGNTGLLANSGNAFGMALFTDTTITRASVPVDVVFIGTGGTLFGESNTGELKGYHVADNDYYDRKDPVTQEDQKFFRSGTNMTAFAYYTADLGIFNKLVGEYSTKQGRWTKVRLQVADTLDKAAPVSEIETMATRLKD